MRRKPTVLIEVSGGVADFNVFPGDADVKVELIDFDNLRGCNDPKIIEDYIISVSQIPARTKGEVACKKNALSALKDQLKICCKGV